MIRKERRTRRLARIAPALMLRKLSNKQFLLVGASVVGIWAGLSAVALKFSVHFLQEKLIQLSNDHYWIYILSPTAGIVLTYLFVKFVLNGELLRGTSHVLFAIAKKSSFLPKKETYSQLASSAITVGMGGSLGLESPIVQTGSAIGSSFASLFPIGYRDRTLLLACGAAAGIATAFNAPIAGVLFALEVLLVDVSISSFIPLLISGAMGALCSKIILSEEVLISFRHISDFNYHNVPYYILLGVACGLVSAFYINTFLWTESLFRKIQNVGFLKAVLGGLMLGGLIIVFPALFGEGYFSIKSLALSIPEAIFTGSPLSQYLTRTPWILGLAVLAVGLIKVFAVSLTLGSGGNGGNFAPSLFVGAFLGFAFAFLFNLTGLTSLPLSNFCLVGMAGLLAGIFHAPLTAIFLIAEITSGYDLIIPLMIVSAISTAFSHYLQPDSLDEAKLKKQGGVINFDKDSHVLSELSLKGIIETDFAIIPHHATLRTLVDAVAHSKRNIFPVVASNGTLVGIISLENIREVMFESSQYDTLPVDQLMRPPLEVVGIHEDMSAVMEKFDKTGLWNIPVLEGEQYKGFVSKSTIFSNYRNKLKNN